MPHPATIAFLRSLFGDQPPLEATPRRRRAFPRRGGLDKIYQSRHIRGMTSNPAPPLGGSSNIELHSLEPRCLASIRPHAVIGTAILGRTANRVVTCS
jgi:hypothetical protein